MELLELYHDQQIKLLMNILTIIYKFTIITLSKNLEFMTSR
jgi:hypothetical protein